VLASRREGLPKVLLEAAACGRPMVASDVPGCREIARTNVNALLVPSDDPVALADAIARLAKDAELRRRFARPAASGREDSRRSESAAKPARCTTACWAVRWLSPFFWFMASLPRATRDNAGRDRIGICEPVLVTGAAGFIVSMSRAGSWATAAASSASTISILLRSETESGAARPARQIARLPVRQMQSRRSRRHDQAVRQAPLCARRASPARRPACAIR